MPVDEETKQLYHRLNDAEWRALERGETTRERLKHDRYAKLLRALGRDESLADDMADTYERQLGTHPDLLPGALAFLKAVHPHMKIALLTNGFSVIQRGRLSRSVITG